MRGSRPWLVVALAWTVQSLAGAAFAQDGFGDDEFGDEFADEFDDRGTTETSDLPPSPPVEQPTAAAGSSEGDEFDDPFGEEDLPDESDSAGTDGASEGFEVAQSESESESESEAGEGTTPDYVDDERTERRLRLHNSYTGPVGGLRVVDARPGVAGTVRTQLLLQFFTAGDFLVPDDSHDHFGGALSLGWTLLDWLEIFGSLVAYSNSNDQGDPSLLQVIGDLRIGAKVGFDVLPWLTVGGDLTLYQPTSSDLDVTLSSFGAQLRANATADLRELPDPLPLIARVNLAYEFHNTDALAEDTENARFGALPDALPRSDETRHLLTSVERFGLGVNRTDFVHVGLGAEAPFEPLDDLVISPLVEYTVGIPVNRQGYDCPFIASAPGSDDAPAGEDGCLDRTGISAIPMDLVLGVRVLPPVRGLSAMLAIEIGLTGNSPGDQVRELAGNAPWMLLVGAGYAFDVRPDPGVPVTLEVEDREVEVAPEDAPQGRVVGRVVDSETGTPVPDARVDYPGRDVTSQLANPDGRFRSSPFEPGQTVIMELTAPDYQSGTCEAVFDADGSDVEVDCPLEANPEPIVVEESEVVVLEKINFAFDSDEILPSSFGLLDSLGRTFRRHPEIRLVEVQGHTDNVGSPSYNRALSQRRAEAVVRALTERDVDATRLRARGYGFDEPVAPNTTDENRAKNRRVQFIIVERDADLTDVGEAVQDASEDSPGPNADETGQESGGATGADATPATGP